MAPEPPSDEVSVTQPTKKKEAAKCRLEEVKPRVKEDDEAELDVEAEEKE